MPWICRKGANGGISGTDDFSDTDADLTNGECGLIASLLKDHNSAILERTGGRVRIKAPLKAEVLELSLKHHGFEWVNRSVEAEFVVPQTSQEQHLASQEHWHNYAKLWQHIKAPLKPGEEDISFIEDALKAHFEVEKLAGLLLGVTQELSKRHWNYPMNITSIDNEMAMIERVWPNPSDRKRVVCGDWFKLPFGASTFDVALGDGSINAVQYSDYDKIRAQLWKVLKRDGLFIVRVYTRPYKTESIDAVFKDLSNIKNFHVFKWRLAMAVQGEDTAKGVNLHHVWSEYSSRIKNHQDLAATTGWPVEEITTINAYQNNKASYSFPSVAEIVDEFSGYLSLIDKRTGSYQLAERCPTLIFKNVG